MRIVQFVRMWDTGAISFPAHGADRVSDVVIIRPAYIKLSTGVR